MVRYRRNILPGGTFFFTVTLADRRSSALVDHIGILRKAFRVARGERPFEMQRVRDWPHSSFHRYVREGVLPEDWAGDAREGGERFGERSNGGM